MEQTNTPDTPAVHPSRTAPHCVACKHFLKVRHATFGVCDHPATPVDVETGRVIATCFEERRGACGPEAVRFEPRTA